MRPISMSRPRWRIQARGGPWLDLLLALLAVGALGATVLADLPVRTSPAAASDLKTLYAAAFCLRHGLNAYNFVDLGRVFTLQGIPPPAQWYGHASVYPPPTLALLAPLTLFSMAGACRLETVGSILLMTVAVAALLREGAVRFGLSFPLRAAVAGACAAGPLLAFALTVGNLSVAASALAILAFLWRRWGPVALPALPLALAILLKPHLAIWVVVALFWLPDRRGRRVAMTATLVAAVLGLLLACSTAHPLAQIAAFLATVHAESSPGGSMFPGSREALLVVSQITSLVSLAGFWTPSPFAGGFALLALLGCLGLLLAGTRRAQGAEAQTLAVAAWSAFGLLLTYHRAHDALLLLVLAPWLAHQLRMTSRRWQPWAMLLLYAALSFGPAPGLSTHTSFWGAAANFLLLRQAALATLLLFFTLLSSLWNTTATRKTSQPAEELVPSLAF